MASNYFFLLSRKQYGSVKLVSTIESGDECRIWSQILDDTQFCLKLNFTQPSQWDDLKAETIEFGRLLTLSSFCDIETRDVNNEDEYKLTIVRYKLYDQLQCRFAQLNLKVYDRNDPHNLLFDRVIHSGAIHSEQCSCPSAEWPSNLGCDSSVNQRLYKQLNKDLR